MSNILLLQQSEHGIAPVTLNRPQVMNALNSALREALVQLLQELARDSRVRVLVMRGASQTFCAGLDLKELSTHGLPPSGLHNDPVAALAAMPCPTIAAVQGVAVTGGLELALACDMVLASSSARFADTHVRMGVLPGWGLSQKLSRLVGQARAMELSMSGNFVGAAQAERWGLINRCVPDDSLDEQTQRHRHGAPGDGTSLQTPDWGRLQIAHGRGPGPGAAAQSGMGQTTERGLTVQ